MRATPWTILDACAVRNELSGEPSDADAEVGRGRRGSVADVSVRIPEDDEGDERLVWQFAIADFDIGFQVLENSVVVQESIRYSASPLWVEGQLEAVKRGSTYTLRWDNSYSLVRGKSIKYRFLVVSKSAYEAAEAAALDWSSRQDQDRADPRRRSSGDRPPLRSRLSSRLELEKTLTEEQISKEQRVLIQSLEAAVMDLVATFMTKPDCPIHEGGVRNFVLAFENVLRNGIKEEFFRAWPEEPYCGFLLESANVLRDDEGLVNNAKRVHLHRCGRFIGWTRARAFLFMALTNHMLHRAFENLIKRRAIVEKFYNPYSVLFIYSTASEIASLLSALNAVQFLISPVVDGTPLEVMELPFNLRQYNADGSFPDGQELLDNMGDVHYSTVSDDDIDSITTLDHCSVARYMLHNEPLRTSTIARADQLCIPLAVNKQCPYAAVQIRVEAQDLMISIIGDKKASLCESKLIDNQWTEIVLRVRPEGQHESICLLIDNSFSLVRSKTIEYRTVVITSEAYDSGWDACFEIAQSISWKLVARAGALRCEEYMVSQLSKEQAQLELSTQETEDSNDAVAPDILGILPSSLITRPVSYIVGGFISPDGSQPLECGVCMTPFSFFSRQIECPSCGIHVCSHCSRHDIPGDNRRLRRDKVCDRCFVKKMDEERKKRKQGDAGTSGAECAAYAALRVDPKMQKYFKMLSFGVPHKAVAQKMLQDEVTAEVVQTFVAGPSGVGESENSPESSARASSSSKAFGRGNSFRKVHWQSLEASIASETIWSRVTTRRKTAPVRLSANDYQALQELFGHSVNSSSAKPKRKVKQKFSALDSRRSNNISIGLSRFKSAGGIEKILTSIQSCDLEYLTLERLSTLEEISPNAVEVKRYTNFRGSLSKLDDAERFLVNMCQIPRVTEKFPLQLDELMERVKLISGACTEIFHSERLARCFELVLAIGNMLNAGTELEDAQGITLGSLLKLSETKAIDGSMTLLQFIVKLIHDRGESDVLLFTGDLSSVSEAKRHSNVICIGQFKSLQSGIRQLEQEINEELVIDRERFEKEEDRRIKVLKTRQMSSIVSERGQKSVAFVPNSGPAAVDRSGLLQAIRARAGDASGADHSSKAEDSSSQQQMARNLLLKAIEARGTKESTSASVEKEENVKKPHTSQVPNSDQQSEPLDPRAALFASIRQRSKNDLDTTNSDSAETPKKLCNVEDSHGASENQNARSALLEGIRNRASNSSTSNPRANLLAAIRGAGPARQSSESALGTKASELTTEQSVRRTYVLGTNRFITVMRDRLLTIKAAFEELEVEIDAMRVAWESTSRYLGEDPASCPSTYAMNLLNRFMLDVKVAKSLLARKGLRFANGAEALFPNIGRYLLLHIILQLIECC
ncbi:TPA: LOW QUALITY PROTEIN: hypothetical protein N0F65_012617 [Lagenidium giganteum]|uniref:Formin-like protein n=1 Tax=Lagenidium giganteum TaxID=4803 RepID=A0AAV2YQ60_9STRA|nr:TPA: LOW QUALITY PROTEIN: hypothetical protein N0F65_012617 [Lagenidium giganteum]